MAENRVKLGRSSGLETDAETEQGERERRGIKGPNEMEQQKWQRIG